MSPSSCASTGVWSKNIGHIPLYVLQLVCEVAQFSIHLLSVSSERVIEVAQICSQRLDLLSVSSERVIEVAQICSQRLDLGSERVIEAAQICSQRTGLPNL